MLLKARKLEFVRIEDDMFVMRFLDADKNVLMTMEPRIIDPDSSYIVDFGTTLVIRAEDLDFEEITEGAL